MFSGLILALALSALGVIIYFIHLEHGPKEHDHHH
ncbi:MAG: hypothetical protein JG774_2023 [Desulfomicrobiaceae bacterium]|jgi:hypothetical protein|nr:hypothetical protein [Desulfomicrobiaceae bacterium]MDK2873437.1 hypothetical protein [Desulfomicrobiaceae bacterium]